MYICYFSSLNGFEWCFVNTTNKKLIKDICKMLKYKDLHIFDKYIDLMTYIKDSKINYKKF